MKVLICLAVSIIIGCIVSLLNLEFYTGLVVCMTLGFLWGMCFSVYFDE